MPARLDAPIRPLGPEAQALAGDGRNIARARHLAARLSAKTPWLRAEIESAALLGLVEAARSFDPARGVRFWAHAGRRVVGAIKDEMRVSGLVRGSRWFGIHPPKVESLDAEIEGPRGVATPAALLESGEHPVGWESESHDGVAGLTRNLPAKHRRAIRLLYGDCRTTTMKQVGRALGLSESRVSQLVTGGFEMIREALNGHSHAALADPEDDDSAGISAPVPPDESNPKSGYKGVYWHKQTGKWQVQAKGKSLGLFADAEAAASARAAYLASSGAEGAAPAPSPPAPAARVPGPVVPAAPSPAPPPVVARVAAPASPGDPEVEAIAAIARTLAGLDPEAVGRVLGWASARFARRTA